MKISIISPSLNSEKNILSNLASVNNQTYSNVEHIIIDGSSTDDTLKIINNYSASHVILKSEKDNGIYDAFNKGLLLATGDIIGILNTDDVYANNEILEKVHHIFATQNTDSIYGDLEFFNSSEKSKITRFWKSNDFEIKNILLGWSPPHPTFFVRRSVIEKFGLYNPDFKISGDYEFMLRLLFKERISTFYLPQVLVKMQLGGVSNKNLKNRLVANLEDRKAWKINGLNPKWYTLYLKPLRKLRQVKKIKNLVNLPLQFLRQ